MRATNAPRQQRHDEPGRQPHGQGPKTGDPARGFARLEQEFGTDTQVQIGLGHTERAPDYWELISKESASSISAFNSVAPERTTQLDLGITHRRGPCKPSPLPTTTRSATTCPFKPGAQALWHGHAQHHHRARH